MTISFSQTLADVFASPVFLSFCASFAALMVAGCGCGRCGGKNDDSEEEKDDGDDEEDCDGADFNFSQDDLREYNEFVEQTNARIEELCAALEDYSGDDAAELENELIQSFLSRAVRRQEEGEIDDATDDYSAAFERIANYTELYGESIDLLRTLGAARLNYAILLNDEGELSEADAEYQRAADATAKLVEFGDRDAKLDLVGIQLNRAAILFETGRQADSLNMLDEAAEEFQKLADATPENNAEALFYLAKTLTTKSDFVRSTLDEDVDDATEANELSRRAIDVYRRLVAAGRSEYKRDLADALVGAVATAKTRSKDDLNETIDNLAEACRLYESVVAIGENDACVDLFDATMKRGELLTQAERTKEALELYDGVVETFEEFKNSDELPLLEGLAIARQRRALLRKDAGNTKMLIPDLTVALELQLRIADSLIETLREGDHSCGCGGRSHSGGEDHSCGCGGRSHSGGEDHSCGCGGHSHSGGEDHSCGCGGRSHSGEGDHSCGCGGRSHSGEGDHSCGCGGRSHSGGEDHSCGCGHCGGECDEATRKFFVERWANDNYNAVMECFFERACAYLEKRDSSGAIADCLTADEFDRAYRAALRTGETLTSDAYKKLRELKASLRG